LTAGFAILVIVAVTGWIVAAALVGRQILGRREQRERVAIAVQAKERAAERAEQAEAVTLWLQATLDESPEAVVVVDRIGREVLRNLEARRFAGARTGEMLAEDVIGELLEAALVGARSERELQLFGPPARVIHVVAFPLRRAGEIVGAAAFGRDVTEAREIDRVRRDFVANVSHELKTPIGALALLAETIAAAEDVEVARPLAVRIEYEADRLTNIVDDLLELSRLEGAAAATREIVAVEALISEASDVVRPAAEAAGVPLLVEPEIDAKVSCDPRQVRSALVNLLDNAVKYSEPGATVEIGAVALADEVRIEVRDHGPGIPTRDLERIFERFYRVDRARSRATGGTGLGLAIVRHVARLQGGEVSVTSREGEGSTFVLHLPRAAPAGGRGG
jgi:two-component system sensor histidine kinase SenX3